MFGFRPDLMVNVLPVMGYGMLGVFLITGFIICVVILLNKFTGSK